MMSWVDKRMIEMADTYEKPQISILNGMRYALRSATNPSNGTRILVALSLFAGFFGYGAGGRDVALLILGLACGTILTRFMTKAVRNRAMIDQESMRSLSSDAQSTLRHGLLKAEPSSDEYDLNVAMLTLLDDRRPNRAAIRRKAATSMVAIRCLHVRTMQEVDESHHARTIEKTQQALRAIRDEALAAIVPVQDLATDLLSERLRSFVAAPPQTPIAPPEPVDPLRTGDARFDALVDRIRSRIALGDRPEDAGGSPVSPILDKHLPSILSAHRKAVADGADRTAADAFLKRSVDAMTASFEEALARPLPTAQSAMDDLETMANFLEARSDRTLSA